MRAAAPGPRYRKAHGAGSRHAAGTARTRPLPACAQRGVHRDDTGGRCGAGAPESAFRAAPSFVVRRDGPARKPGWSRGKRGTGGAWRPPGGRRGERAGKLCAGHVSAVRSCGALRPCRGGNSRRHRRWPRALRAVWGSVHGERLWDALHGHDIGPLRAPAAALFSFALALRYLCSIHGLLCAASAVHRSEARLPLPASSGRRTAEGEGGGRFRLVA